MFKTIGITMGDPTGIGPEVAVKALQSDDIRQLLPTTNFLIIGDEAVLHKAAQAAGVGFKPILLGLRPELPPQPGIYLLCPKPAKTGPGAMALACINQAIELAMATKPVIDALVTGPVSKSAINKSGQPFTGHTEWLARQTHTRKVVMMFCTRNLKVALVTTHIPYKKLLLHLDTAAILDTIRITNDGLKQYFGFHSPRIAVCGLNPHAGESGLMGKEDNDIVAPAVAAAKEQGVLCFGPMPADSVFHKAIEGGYDAVVALYHDQGIIPVKTIAFFESVQVTLGLPIIRVSVAHGTAQDIAGKAVANPASMIEAIKLARQMTGNGGKLF